MDKIITCGSIATTFYSRFGMQDETMDTASDIDNKLDDAEWTSKEDECLAKAWKTVSIHPITGANQNTDTYTGRIKTAFDECKMVDPDFANIHMDCGQKAMLNY
ncbi:putative methionyl-tRNA synthetase [Hordeum vulgare]|nr:putative methionyl-tRNA synthetase [Hordeum vulgare]